MLGSSAVVSLLTSAGERWPLAPGLSVAGIAGVAAFVCKKVRWLTLAYFDFPSDFWLQYADRMDEQRLESRKWATKWHSLVEDGARLNARQGSCTLHPPSEDDLPRVLREMEDELERLHNVKKELDGESPPTDLSSYHFKDKQLDGWWHQNERELWKSFGWRTDCLDAVIKRITAQTD